MQGFLIAGYTIRVSPFHGCNNGLKDVSGRLKSVNKDNKIK